MKRHLAGYSACLLLLIASAAASPASAILCDDPELDACDWTQGPTRGTVPGGLGHLDFQAVYWQLKWEFDATKMLHLRGDFGVARYESYTVTFYSETEPLGDAYVTATDLDLVPFTGSCNPTASPDPACAPREYRIVVVAGVHAAAASAALGPDHTVIPAPPGTAFVRLQRRTYVDPDPIEASPAFEWLDPTLPGLPEVPAPRATSTLSLPRPEPTWDGPEDPCAGMEAGTCDETLELYAPVISAGLGPNQAGIYMKAELVPLTTPGADLVVWTLPTPPRSAQHYPAAALDSEPWDLRYYSFCLSYERTSLMGDCLADFELAAQPGGEIRIVIGKAGKQVFVPGQGMQPLEDVVAARGDNFLDWGAGKGIRWFLYRNTIYAEPDWVGNFLRMPPCTGTGPGECPMASEYAGSYAPIGKHCTPAAYVASGCEEPPPPGCGEGAIAVDAEGQLARVDLAALLAPAFALSLAVCARRRRGGG